MSYKRCGRCGQEYPPGSEQPSPYCLACRKAYREARKAHDPEGVKATNRRYNQRQQARTDRVCVSCHQAPATKDGRCRTCGNAYTREWRRKHADRIRQYNRDTHRRLREEVLAHYGGRCACCGEAQYEFLALDHLDGGGAADRRAAAGQNKHLWRWVKHQGLPAGFRVLCHNCNMAIGFYGHCPHQSLL